jgi:hypothetical protein
MVKDKVLAGARARRELRQSPEATFSCNAARKIDAFNPARKPVLSTELNSLTKELQGWYL